MPINPDAAGTEGEPHESTWDSTSCLLYALGVGAGATDATGFELEFTTENSADVTQRALPTMAVVLGGGGTGMFAALGEFNPAMLVHGEQSVTLHKPLPVSATVTTTSRIADIFDKTKAALVVLENTAVDNADGEPLFTTSSALFIRGEGGWGGERGPSGPRNEPPDRPPDEMVTYTTRPDQALLYRLNGDRNPLHSDPSFAAMAGFDRPILHGLCTYGFTGRALLHAVCGSDPDRFAAMEGRFSQPVMPGDQLDVHIWEDDDGAVFQTRVGDRVVIDAGKLTVR
jgi:acyl dehydratase